MVSQTDGDAESKAMTDPCGWLENRWRRCNLRGNPFGELTAAERAVAAIVDVEPYVEFLSFPRAAVQFVGRCGRGKTTRLLTLCRWFPEATYTYLPPDQPCPAIPAGRPVIIDEAQRMSRAVRRRVFDSGLPLILATHRDWQRKLRRCGYTVLSERIGRGNTPELIHRIVNRRIEAARLDPGPIPVVPPAVAAGLYRRFGSDIRSIELFLYELAQTQVNRRGEVRFDDCLG